MEREHWATDVGRACLWFRLLDVDARTTHRRQTIGTQSQAGVHHEIQVDLGGIGASKKGLEGLNRWTKNVGGGRWGEWKAL